MSDFRFVIVSFFLVFFLVRPGRPGIEKRLYSSRFGDLVRVWGTFSFYIMW